MMFLSYVGYYAKYRQFKWHMAQFVQITTQITIIFKKYREESMNRDLFRCATLKEIS